MPMTIEQKNRLEVQLSRALKAVQEDVNVGELGGNNCYTCLELEPNGGFCRTWGAAPPEEFLERGCDKWEPDVPF